MKEWYDRYLPARPIASKNPQICDYLIQKALEKVWADDALPLDDSQEQRLTSIYRRFVKE